MPPVSRFGAELMQLQLATHPECTASSDGAVDARGSHEFEVCELYILRHNCVDISLPPHAYVHAFARIR